MSTLNTYRLVAFDFDGTLADSFGWFAGVAAEVAERFSLRPAEEIGLEAMRGMTTRQLIGRLGVPTWKLPLMARHVRKLQARDIGRISLFDGVRDMLAGLVDAGVKVAVVSSNAERNVRAVLGERDATLVTHFGCGASLFGKRAKLATCLRSCGVPPAQALYVGDEVRDVEAAKAVGMASGVVSWGFATVESLLAAGPTKVFAAPADVLRTAVGPS